MRTRLVFRPAAGLVLSIALITGTAAAQTKNGTTPLPKKSYTAARVNPQTPVVDGRLDDPAWAKAAWEGGFVQHEPYEGREPSERTEYKVLYDDKAVYVAVRAHDSEAKTIERRLARRDNCDGDHVIVWLDSMFDRLTAFQFSVNAAGVKADQIVVNDGITTGGGEEDMSWDPIWDAATTIDDGGWTAEMCIPLSQLRFGKKEEQIWGLQVGRVLFRKNETSLWQPIPRNAPGYVHLFGELRGLAGLAAPHQIEIMPYAVGRLQAYRPVAGNPYAKGSEGVLLGGVDGKVGVTSDLTMNFSINPDFGQVEADPSVVNLTAYETFYEEKRPFFVEGKAILDYQISGGDGDYSMDNLFYSRRIGRSPQFTPSTDGYMDFPAATSILGAFKLTGKTRSGVSIGILESVTSEERASIFSQGATSTLAVEPLTNYFSVRAQKDWNAGATILGGMLTATNRSLGNDHLRFLHDAAYAGGVDFYHSWNNKNYYLSFKGVASNVVGTPEALLRTQTSSVHYFQRPDADYVDLDPARTSLSGHGGTLETGKFGGGHWMYVLGVSWRSPGLELNDMGYLRQADTAMQYAWAGYQIWEPFGPFRSLQVSLNQWTGWNFGGESIFKGGNAGVWCQFKNYWSGSLYVNLNGSGLSATSLRGGPSLHYPSGTGYSLGLQTDARKPIRLMLFVNTFRRNNGDTENWNWQPGLTFVPSAALSLSLSPTYATNRSVLQYVGTQAYGEDPRYVFGTIDQKTLGLTIRLNYSLTPDLSIQFYGMPFVSAGKYGAFKRITDSRAKDYGARYLVFGPAALSYDATARTYSVDENGDGAADYGFGDPDFNFRQLRANLVLRWEYIPGSTLFLVWSQGRTGFRPDGSFAYGRDMNELFDVHPENVFLIKFSYCFQL